MEHNTEIIIDSRNNTALIVGKNRTYFKVQSEIGGEVPIDSYNFTLDGGTILRLKDQDILDIKFLWHKHHNNLYNFSMFECHGFNSNLSDELFDYLYKNGKYLLNDKQIEDLRQYLSYGFYSEEKVYVQEKTTKKKSNSFIYLAIDEKNCCVKIGHSTNPKCRESTLQSEKPYIKMMLIAKGTYKDEKSLHEEFNYARIRGEWFNLNLHNVISISKRYQNIIPTLEFNECCSLLPVF